MTEDGQDRNIAITEEMSLNEKFELCISYIRKQTIITGFKVAIPSTEFILER